MTKAEGLRSAELAAALDRAIAGKRADLYRQLELQSGLPGPRVNMNLGLAFAHECARLGARSDELAYAMASLPPDEARGASGKEFVSVCGVLAVGARATSAEEGAVRERALALLEEKADDPRFRVRDAVPLALAALGSAMKGELAERVEPWMDRYFHATAVIRALAEPAWLETFATDDPGPPLRLLQAAYDLAHDAPRSAFRYPGHKALVEALGSAPKAVARRFSAPMFERYAAWAEKVKIPELRDAILANVDDTQMKKAFGEEMKRIKALVQQSKGPPRDPTILRHGTRGRGKKRERR
ncbi:MAG: hypothetical protein KIS78_15690 [Labilithrix sp.]|nr:hypothetical protein [Labilithrix sp.]MCW5833844.1 hypothetical protein [Labilithrix sp.]